MTLFFTYDTEVEKPRFKKVDDGHIAQAMDISMRVAVDCLTSGQCAPGVYGVSLSHGKLCTK